MAKYQCKENPHVSIHFNPHTLVDSECLKLYRKIQILICWHFSSGQFNTIYGTNKKSKCSDDSHSCVKLEKMCLLCPLNTHQSHKAYCAWSFWFVTCVATMHQLNHHGQFAVDESDIRVTLKGQGHQTWYGLLDPKQD